MHPLGCADDPFDSIPRYRVYAESVSLKVGQVPKRGWVNLQTIRFYEREGLSAEPPRPTSGYRMFPKTAIRRVRLHQARTGDARARQSQDWGTLRERPAPRAHEECPQQAGRDGSRPGQRCLRARYFL
jgi:hypothetical protein